VVQVFPPLATLLKPEVLQEGEGDQHHQGVVVQAGPGFEALLRTPSKWSRPSSSFICWCACSQTQRALYQVPEAVTLEGIPRAAVF
jgi:hypothetical protein